MSNSEYSAQNDKHRNKSKNKPHKLEIIHHNGKKLDFHNPPLFVCKSIIPSATRASTFSGSNYIDKMVKHIEDCICENAKIWELV